MTPEEKRAAFPHHPATEPVLQAVQCVLGAGRGVGTTDEHLPATPQKEVEMLMPGPGDEVTWGACCGHPHDPRTETYEGDLEWPEDDEDAEYEEPDETD